MQYEREEAAGGSLSHFHSPRWKQNGAVKGEYLQGAFHPSESQRKKRPASREGKLKLMPIKTCCKNQTFHMSKRAKHVFESVFIN